MAVYVIVEADNKSGWTDDPALRFKYRHYSKDGHRTAQEVFEKLCKQGRKVHLVRWTGGRVVARETNDAKEVLQRDLRKTTVRR
jgi:hypothetical protein